MNNITQELIIAAALIVLLTLIGFPAVWMPPMAIMSVLVVLALVFIFFASLVWREQAHDEREQLHRMLADRLAFLVGSALLLAAITIQTIQHRLDVWVVFALGAMVLAKITGLLYGQYKK